jgi:thiamine phosphate synthase YjbQ (UPF0047 family)
MVYQDTLQLADRGEGAYEITDLITEFIRESNIRIGTCQLFIHSSSASFLIVDTADESIKKETAAFMAKLAPSSDSIDNNITSSMEVYRSATASRVSAYGRGFFYGSKTNTRPNVN